MCFREVVCLEGIKLVRIASVIVPFIYSVNNDQLRPALG